MRLSKQAGFSLLELLAAIVILGILSIIGIVAITNIKANQEKKFNQTQYELFKETAKTYFSDNKSKLPSVSGSTRTVYLEELIDQNYLDSLLDYDKNSYQVDKSYVTVRRIGSKYVYVAYLYQIGNDSNPVEKEEEKNPSVITFSNYRKSSGTVMNMNENTHYTNTDSKVDVKIEDEDGIMAFNYSIYKNNKKIYTSEYIEPNGNNASDTITLNTSDYEDGIYIIKFTVYDNGEHIITKKSDEIMIDRVAPSCSTTKTPTATWTNQNVTVKGNCSDNIGKNQGNSGCVASTITRNYTTQMNSTTSPGTVKDRAGNITECPTIAVNIDLTKPSCTVSGESTTWVKGTRNITAKCTDTGRSGCVKESDVVSYKTTTKTASFTYKVKDNAGNEASCKSTVNVYVDNTSPSCTSSGGSASWTSDSRTLKGTCKDNESGCVSQTNNDRTYDSNGNVSWLINWQGSWTNLSPGTVCDKVGNCASCPNNQTVKIDKTSPSLTCTIKDANDTDGVNVSVSASDNDGSGMQEYTTLYKNKKSDFTITVKDNVGNSKSCNVNVTAVEQTKNKTRKYKSCSSSACGSATGCSSWGGWVNSGCRDSGTSVSTGCQSALSTHPNTVTKQWRCIQVGTCYQMLQSNSCSTPIYPTCRTSSCGYEDWGSWNSWSTAKCTESDLKKCKSRTIYTATVN